MNDTIKVIETGYYHPSNANWSYHIFMIVDETGARLYRSTFGSEAPMMEKLNNNNTPIERLHAGRGSFTAYKWADVKHMQDIEHYEGKNW